MAMDRRQSITFRKVKITNNIGTESIELNDFDGYLMTSPTGLGIYLNNDYLVLANRRIRTEQKNAFNDIKFNIEIYGDTRDDVEAKYIQLRNFISKNRVNGFKFYYIASGTRFSKYNKYINCDIKILDKTEKSGINYMSVPLTLEPRSLWKTDEQKSSTVQTLGNSNIFKFNYDSAYSAQDNTIVYNIVGNILGETQITLPSGYDATVPPFEVSFTINGVNISNEDKVVSGEDYEMVYEKEVDGKKYVVKFNLEEGTIKAMVYKRNQSLLSLPSSYLNLSIKKGVLLAQKVGLSGYKVTALCTARINCKTKSSTSFRDYVYGADFTPTIKIGEDEDSFHAVVMEGEGNVYDDDKSSATLYWGEAVKYSYMLDTTNTYELEGTIYRKYVNPYVVSFLLGNEQYDVAFDVGAVGMNEVINDGDTEIPARIIIRGYALNPSLKLIPKNEDEPTQIVRINAEIPNGAYLEINSDAENTGIWLVFENTGVVNDYTQFADITTNMYIRLPQGSWEILSQDETASSVQTDIFYSKEYYGA